ncbi:hypothetical protein TNCV_4520821 [Trichonephila clavipes]|nr:hypothetical protein TNCV_4520821 [Trichonephila clavipes]
MQSGTRLLSFVSIMLIPHSHWGTAAQLRGTCTKGRGWGGDKTWAYMQISIARKRERKMRMVSFRVLSSAQKEKGEWRGDGYQQGG